MIQINQCKLPINHSQKELNEKVRTILKLNTDEKFTVMIRKRSIDARKKPDIYYVYQLWVSVARQEERLVKRLHHPSVSMAKEKSYCMPKPGDKSYSRRPVIIGAGPAGLFAAYLLTEMGYAPVILERGKQVDARSLDVARFWEKGILDPGSNVQFGEGGAGTFSDGKLNTAVKDPAGRSRFVLETFVRYGAPGQILFDQKPHIGTDILAKVIAQMRNDLTRKGAKFCFESQVTDFVIEHNALREIVVNGTTHMPVDAVVLAIGHSARDTFQVLNAKQVPMECKNFAVGFRVEHPQRMMNEYLYGTAADMLPAAPYKVTLNFPDGRGVYSFCMCPGGYVVNSSSGAEQTVVNGMSYSGRNGKNANSAIIISVTTKDFGTSDALAGMRYQMQLEKTTYELGSGKIPQQLYGDYMQKVISSGYGDFSSETKGAVAFANLRGLFSEDMERSFSMGMEHFSRIIPGFDRKDAILSGVESRTSSPVRIIRGENFMSSIGGLYPCGEGAGYAGGIMSAAMDGIKVAEAIISNGKPCDII